ncbi:MAG: dipeptidyl aminopeptidase [Comamonadaceae bacterium]|nr:MAG: dipeptidyl aminopeptidase [Comamonadaceae bacterium]
MNTSRLLKSMALATLLVAALPVVSGASAQELPAPSRRALQQPETVTLPLSVDGSQVRVIAHLYKPAGDGPFPLVLFAHGRAGTSQERADLKFPIGVSHANYWLQKGVAVLAPIRPGYGQTAGADREISGVRWDGGTCIGAFNAGHVASVARQTQAAALAWAQSQPWVRADRVLLEGQSVGGMTTVALSALNPKGVVGAVNFSGGTGGNPHTSPGRSCQPDVLTRLYGDLGQQVRMPNLWLYASNDQYWGPDAPLAWHQAFKAGGSDTALLQTGPVEGTDGHQLVNRGGSLWRATLDAFVQKTGLLAP